MNYDIIANETVKSAFVAWNNGDRIGFLKLISEDTKFVHNGEEESIIDFSDQFFFGPISGLFIEIHGTEDSGRSVFASLASEATGTVNVRMRFEVADGLIKTLNAGRP
jgi:ketosteroid isomerase-like protein